MASNVNRRLVGVSKLKKILAVDDSASMRSMLSFTINKAGYQTTEAEDGVHGLEVANGSKFDLIVTDINMPNMNGFELIEELRKLDTYKYTPILVLSTEFSAEKKAKGRQVGATGWLVKPFDPDQLISVISRVLP